MPLHRTGPRRWRTPRHVALIALAALAATVSIAAAGCGDDTPPATATSAKPLVVAAAANLRPTLTKLADRYEAQTGRRVTLTFGATGQLAQQLENGAPFDLLAAADTTSIDKVIKAGRGDAATRSVYAYGRLALWSPGRRYTLADLASGTVERVAVAQPDVAPYGRAAIEALRASDLYVAVRPKLVYGQNVGAAQQLAESGNAEAAFIALALAKPAKGAYTVVPTRLHAPIAQAAVVTATGASADAAKGFLALLTGPEGERQLKADGYLLPRAVDGATTP